ncbi:MAG: membrane protease YdiL (CAAX protease family) [Parvicellaceae bacterium]|jgi:membrane protease YdiL (CAAX protease family)
MRKPLFQTYSPGVKFLLALVVVMIAWIMVRGIGLWVGEVLSGVDLASVGEIDYSDSATINAIRISSTIGNFGFLIGAILFSWLCCNQITSYFHLKSRFKFKYLWVVILVFILAVPAVNFLSIINEMIYPGEALDEMQDASYQVKSAILNTTNGWTVVLNILTMALVPAICEELFFRGVLLRLSYQGTGRIHLGVIMSALVFALFHREFDNILSITFMGVILGYLYVYSGTILVPILLHFLNNSIYIILSAVSAGALAETTVPTELMIWIVSGLVCLFLLLFFLKRSVNQEGWNRMQGSLLRD